AVDAALPTRVVSPITDWATVQIGGRHACALSRSFGMYCWGDGTHGQLGNAKANTQELEPVSVQLENVVQFSVGLAHTCAITREGRLFCWGQASGGELGDPSVALPDRGDQIIPTLATS